MFKFRQCLNKRLFSSVRFFSSSKNIKPFGGQIQYISDIHLDKNPFDHFPVKKDPQAETLIIAGDLGNPFSSNFWSFFKYNCQQFKDVLFVPGNHEYYYDSKIADSKSSDHNYDHNHDLYQLGTYKGTQAKLLELEKEFINLRILIKNQHDIQLSDGETISILGCTLWSQIPAQHQAFISKRCPDYQRISYGDSLLTPSITNTLHMSELEWLKERIDQLKIMKRRVLVVTHHAPLIKGICHPRYLGWNKKTGEMDRARWGNYAFSTDLEWLLGSPIAAWIFGHTHYRVQFQHSSGTVIAQNHLGYVKKPYQSIRTL